MGQREKIERTIYIYLHIKPYIAPTRDKEKQSSEERDRTKLIDLFRNLCAQCVGTTYADDAMIIIIAKPPQSLTRQYIVSAIFQKNIFNMSK